MFDRKIISISSPPQILPGIKLRGKHPIQSIFLNSVSENKILIIINQFPFTSAEYDYIPSKLLKITIEHIKKP